jgi:hypothetical protein
VAVRVARSRIVFNFWSAAAKVVSIARLSRPLGSQGDGGGGTVGEADGRIAQGDPGQIAAQGLTAPASAGCSHRERKQGINSAIAASNRDVGTENEFLAEGYPLGGHHGKDSIHMYRTRRLAG